MMDVTLKQADAEACKALGEELARLNQGATESN